MSIKSALNTMSTRLNDDNIAKVNSLIDDLASKIEEEKKHHEKFQRQINYLEKFNDNWLEFIKSGQSYYQSIGKSLPSELDPCIFCSQLLDEQHIEKIQSCFEHVNSNSIQQKVAIEREILKHNINDFKLQLSVEDEELLGREILVGKIKTIISLINENVIVFSKAIHEKNVINISSKINFDDVFREIDKEIKSIDYRLGVLTQTSQDTQSLISVLQENKNKIHKAILINKYIDLFEEWFVTDDYIKYLQQIKKNFSTKSVTGKAKEAFNELVEEKYKSTFKGNCKKLKVREVEVKLKPQKGKTYRNKYVSRENFKVTDIMSEGEQKAIAMAEFATDLEMRGDRNTVIFDDPVTSLDYKRTEYFAKLIYNLSKERQVIVFTHNIMFYYFLYNQCESEKNVENKFFKVDSFDINNKGIVSETFSGRLDNVRDIKSRINKHTEKIKLKTCVGDELEYTISLAYTEIRTWCELIVEEGFFKNIIRRYEPNIRFTKLTNINGEFVDELTKVSDLFERSCRWMVGHSQPKETLHTKPDREYFFEDLEYIKRLTNKFTETKW